MDNLLIDVKSQVGVIKCDYYLWVISIHGFVDGSVDLEIEHLYITI